MMLAMFLQASTDDTWKRRYLSPAIFDLRRKDCRNSDHGHFFQIGCSFLRTLRANH